MLLSRLKQGTCDELGITRLNAAFLAGPRTLSLALTPFDARPLLCADMRSSRHEPAVAGCLVAVVLFLVAGWTYASAHFEAAAYERVTGKKVSTWDAIFLDLRVQESPK